MHHNKSTSIKFVAGFAGGGEREREPLQPHLCVPQNLELLGPGAWGRSAVGRNRLSMRPQQTRVRLRAVRLASQTPGLGGLAGRPGTSTGPRNTCTRGWLAPARVSFPFHPKPRAKKYNPVCLVLSCLVHAYGAAKVPHWGGRRCACSLPLP
jgi:hypothetical protein